MKRWLKWLLIIVGVLLLVVVGVVVNMSRDEGINMVHHYRGDRELITRFPSDYGLEYQEVKATTADGLQLVAWYLPTENGATVIAQHGFKGFGRQDLLTTTHILNSNGYGVLVTSMRAHDLSDGVDITLGRDEMKDFEAWYQFLLDQPEVDPEKIGIVAESYGAAMSLKYATQNPKIKALVIHSTFADFQDTVEIAVEHLTGMKWPFVPLIIYFAEKEADVKVSEIDATEWIAQIAPRPVFVLMGGKDDHISLDSGEQLFAAAGEPKEYWFEPEAGHHGLEEPPYTEEFETKVIGFLGQYLLGE